VPLSLQDVGLDVETIEWEVVKRLAHAPQIVAHLVRVPLRPEVRQVRSDIAVVADLGRPARVEGEMLGEMCDPAYRESLVIGSDPEAEDGCEGPGAIDREGGDTVDFGSYDHRFPGPH
jgi:hypothetical protein